MNINQKQIHIKNNKNSVVNFYGTFSYIFFCWMMSKNVFVMAKYDAFYALQWTLIQFIFFFLMILLVNKFLPFLVLIDKNEMFLWSQQESFLLCVIKHFFLKIRQKMLCKMISLNNDFSITIKLLALILFRNIFWRKK